MALLVWRWGEAGLCTTQGLVPLPARSAWPAGSCGARGGRPSGPS